MKESLRLTPDPAWIRARKALLRELKAEVVNRIGPEEPDLRAYRKRYEREFHGRWKISTKSELLEAIARCDLVYGGDFHASAQAQRTHLRILRAISDARPVTLALECFSHNARKWLELYLRNQITTDELKTRVKWNQSWGFPWEHYRPLIELAKRRGFRIEGLNEIARALSHRSIAKREQFAARRIAEVLSRAPDQGLVYVIFGDLHLAHAHLPKLVEARSGSLRELVIHLNSEKIYFQLAARGRELSTDIVRLDADRYCVMSSPPWVQWQSYLLYLERASDSVLGTNLMDEGDFDPTDQVANFVRLLERELKLTDLSDNKIELKLDDLEIYSADESKVWRGIEKNEKKLTSVEREIARSLLASGRSFFLAGSGTGTGYLARATVNHASTLAGQYLQAKLSGLGRAPWRMPGDFNAMIWIEAAGYFASKLINHHRRAPALHELRAQLALAGHRAQENQEVLKLVVDRAMSELLLVRQGRRRALRFRPRQKSSYLEAARILGGMMGERLYIAHRSRRLNGGEILQLFALDVTRKSFARDYESVVRRLSEVDAEIGTRLKRERL